MEAKNCKKCGKIYAYDGIHKVCPKCRQEEEEEFRRVREYIYDNPQATIQVISEDTDVTTKKILRYLKEGRLELRENNHNNILDCEQCGTSIRTGRFCDKCRVEMERAFKKSLAEGSDRERVTKEVKDKMYTIDRRRS